jgi:hypothetical protein
VRLRGIQVAVDVRVERFADPLSVEHEIRRALYRYVNPLGGSLDDDPDGWAFGRAVTDGDLRAVVHTVPRVKDIALLRIYECDPATGAVRPNASGATVVIGPDELVCSGNHAVSCRRD